MKFWWVAAIVLLITGCTQRAAYHRLSVAILHERHRETDEALYAFQAAADLLPEDPYIRRQLGLAFLRRGMYEEARMEFESVLALEPAYVDAYRDVAALHRAQRMPDVAIAWLEQATRFVPDYVAVYEDLVDLHLLSDRPDEAMRVLVTVLEGWPETVWAHYRMGHLQHQLKAYELAEASFRRSLELQPELDHAQAFLGNSLYEQEKFEEAIEAYQAAIDRDPRDHRSINNLAWVYAVLGDQNQLDEGIRLSRRSLHMDPESATYLDTLAELYYRKSQFTKAVEIIRYAISLGSEDPALREHLAKQLKKFMAADRGKV